jgi:transposase-like protein
MTRPGRYPQELRERAVRLVFEHQNEHPSQWAAICSIAHKFGVSAETLRKWVRQAETDTGSRSGLTTVGRGRPRPLRPPAPPVAPADYKPGWRATAGRAVA